MKDNPLLKLTTFGHSIWLDFIQRGMITSGQLRRFIDADGLRGMTSNPSIFEKAIAASTDYDDSIRDLAREGMGIDQIYNALTITDIQSAADLFRQVYDRLDGADGFVSLEVSPLLAHDTAATIADARRLWAAVARPNVMIKVPATLEGLPAIRQLIGEGINVNVTLLFALPRYRQVAEAYLAGLEDLAKRGKPLGSVASVASFFLSRIDVLLDPVLEKLMAAELTKADLAGSFRGQVAILSARSAYGIYQEVFGGERFANLKLRGARTQRLLWASTSTKNPDYDELKYVEALIGPETVDTIPLETLAAYRDHGQPAPRLLQHDDQSTPPLQRLAETGIDLDAVTRQLEDDGVRKFVVSYEGLLKTLQDKRDTMLEQDVTG